MKVEIRITIIDPQERPFYNNEFIESIIIERPNKIIPSGLEKGYFESCTKLTIPNYITRICRRAFYSCCKLKEIYIPISVRIIESEAFAGCTSLKKITIPSTIQSIGENCFEGCTLVELSNDMDEIPNDTFKECKSLREIIIPQSIKKIGNNSFSGCTSLNAITIPKSVKEVGENCFEGCISLKQVAIDLFYTNIEKSTFKGCLQLQDIITRKRKTENMKSSSLSEERIIISSKQTEILFDENILESSYFLSSISEFKEIIFEIRYPTESFERIYRLINKLKKNPNKYMVISLNAKEKSLTKFKTYSW